MCHRIISLMSSPQAGKQKDGMSDRKRQMNEESEEKEKDEGRPAWGLFPPLPSIPFPPTPLSLIGLKL